MLPFWAFAATFLVFAQHRRDRLRRYDRLRGDQHPGTPHRSHRVDHASPGDDRLRASDNGLPYERKNLPATAVNASASNSRANGESVGIAAADATVTVDVAALFAGFVSVFEDVTVAVFDTGPVVDGSVRVSAIVAAPPLLIVPSEQVTVVVPLQLP
jgi:hypothetical protein